MRDRVVSMLSRWHGSDRSLFNAMTKGADVGSLILRGVSQMGGYRFWAAFLGGGHRSWGPSILISNIAVVVLGWTWLWWVWG